MKIGDRVCIIESPLICRDLWHKLGVIEDIKLRPASEFTQAQPPLIVIKVDDPKRQGHPDMPYLQVEDWAIHP